MHLRNPALAFLALLLALLPAPESWPGTPARPVALVTDLQGKVTRAGGASLTILAELAAGARLKLPEHGRVQLLMVGDGQCFHLLGPGEFRLHPDGPRAEDGGKVRRGTPLAAHLRELRLRPARIAQASITMRGHQQPPTLELSYPVGIRLMDGPARFAWVAVPKASGYLFQLMDEGGRLIHEARTDSPGAFLPPGIRLKPGEFYAWQVRALFPDGPGMDAWAEFGIADTDLRRKVDEARPTADADFSSRLLFALFLDQQGLREEARRTWQALARERPDELRLRALAAER